MPDTDKHLRKLADFLGSQAQTAHLTYEDVAQATTRDELGISSLNAILLIANYIKEQASSSVTIKPEWVPRMNDVQGMVSIILEIDGLALQAQSA